MKSKIPLATPAVWLLAVPTYHVGTNRSPLYYLI